MFVSHLTYEKHVGGIQGIENWGEGKTNNRELHITAVLQDLFQAATNNT